MKSILRSSETSILGLVSLKLKEKFGRVSNCFIDRDHEKEISVCDHTSSPGKTVFFCDQDRVLSFFYTPKKLGQKDHSFLAKGLP